MKSKRKSSKSSSDCGHCSEPSAKGVKKSRGCLQQPNTGNDARSLKTIKKTRTLTIKVKPDSEQWARIKELAYQAMHYKNCQMRAKWAESIGLRVSDSDDKHGLSKTIRKMEKGELSGAVYAAAEREVQGAWQRDGKRIMAGFPWSQWRQGDNLSVRGDGIRLFYENDQYIISLAVQNKTCDGGCWMALPIVEHTGRDKYLQPILDGMVSESIKPLKATVIFKPNKGKMLVRIAYSLEIMVPPMGERVATISNINGRFMLRCELANIDYTARLTSFSLKKKDYDKTRRRISCQIGKRKGHARTKRKLFMRYRFEDYTKTHIHQWTAEVIKWCIAHGVGTISIIDLGGGDWPAHMFEQDLTYKAEESGMQVVQNGSLEDASTERAVDAEVKKARRKAKKLGDAVRTLNAALS